MKHIWPIALAFVLSACEEVPSGEDAPFAPTYLGITTQLLEGDLVNFKVEMTGARDAKDVEDYARCAAAQYALIRGYGFAQHGSAYLISNTLPRGMRTIDAEVTVASCRENKIPTV